MRVFGIDPGSAVTGFGVVERSAGAMRHVVAGVIRSNPRDGQGARLRTIFDGLCALLEQHVPAAVSLERSFVAHNVQSAFRLGEARAMALLAASRAGLPLFEYAPAEVKLSVAGYGQADKEQMKFAVRRALALPEEIDLLADAADALALAMCHLSMARMGAALAAGEGRPRRSAWKRPA